MFKWSWRLLFKLRGHQLIIIYYLILLFSFNINNLQVFVLFIYIVISLYFVNIIVKWLSFYFYRYWEWNDSEPILTWFQFNSSTKLFANVWAACQSHSYTEVLNHLQVLVLFEFFKWDKQVLLSFFINSHSGINYIGCQNVILFFFYLNDLLFSIWLNIYLNYDVSIMSIVLYRVLDYIE